MTQQKCPACGENLDATGSGAAPCTACGGLWVSSAVLRACVARFLEQSGHDGAIIALHEAPRGTTPRKCPQCAAALDLVDLRGVTVDRCKACDCLFLKPGDTDLISQRVLISARAPKGRQPLSTNPILADMLRNPRSSGGG